MIPPSPGPPAPVATTLRQRCRPHLPIAALVVLAACQAGPKRTDVHPREASATRGEAATVQQQRDAVRDALAAGRLGAAQRDAADLVHTYPDNQEAHLLCVETQRATDDPAALHAELRRWLRTHPTSARTWHALAQCLLDHDLPNELGGPAAAVDAAERALSLHGGDDARMLVTLGTAHYLAGEVSAAIAAYERALVIPGGLATERAELAELLDELRREG